MAEDSMKTEAEIRPSDPTKESIGRKPSYHPTGRQILGHRIREFFRGWRKPTGYEAAGALIAGTAATAAIVEPAAAQETTQEAAT